LASQSQWARAGCEQMAQSGSMIILASLEGCGSAALGVFASAGLEGFGLSTGVSIAWDRA
jgi:hypothetical protein